nr:hypothetical protein [Tanacetum cinerariifolium]
NHGYTKAQQTALDDDLVAPANHLKIGKRNHRLSFTLKSNEPTLQVVLDAMKLTPFYNAFQITANVPEIYIQEFWATVSILHTLLRFKMNDKSHTLNLENFKDMLQICPKLPEPPKAKTKYKKNADEPVTSSKTKTVPASKGCKLKSSAKMAKTAKKKQPATMPKTKGLVVLSEVALSEAEQIKLATKRSKKDFHMSHASGSSDGVNIQSKDDADEETDVNDDSEETEFNNDGDDLTHPNLSTYKEDDDEEEEEKANDDEVKEGEEEQEEEEEIQQQSSSVSSDLVSKFINPYLNIGSVDNYLDSNMKEAVDVDSTMKTIIKEQVQAQVSKIMPKIKKNVTRSLGAEVLVGSTNQPQTSYAVAASLSGFKLKKILIDKTEENQSVKRSDIHKNLYNALVESYNSNKDIFSSYGDIVTLKRGRDDQEKDEDPSAGSNRGSKRRRSDKEVESSKELTHKESKSTSSSKDASRSQLKSSGKSAHADKHGQKVDDLEDQSHQEFNTGNDDETSNERGRQVIPWDYFINNDLEYLKGGSSSQKYTTSITKTEAADYGQVKWIEDKRFYGYASNMESSYDVYSRNMIIAVTRLKIMEWFGYSHLEEIIFRRQDDKLYKFREGDFKRLRRKDIEDMLLLLVQDKLFNLNLEERSRKLPEEDQPQKADTYCSDLQRMTPYTAYPDIQGIIFEDEMNKNRLMLTNELYKFSDDTLNHVRTALNDISTRIEMDYLPKQKWSKKDKQRARVMINAIDRKLRDRRLMRNLEKFVGGKPYEGDLRLLKRTI